MSEDDRSVGGEQSAAGTLKQVSGSGREAEGAEEAVSQLAPFQDFSSAARTVFGRLCGIRDDPLEELIGRLLSTVLLAEERAQEAAARANQAELDSLADTLTGLANRRAWIRLLAIEEDRCRRHCIDTSVAVIDLDGLKGVNDELGHAAGDEILRRAGRAIVAQTRAHDVVARLGGDEFGVLATHCSEAEAQALMERLVQALDGERISASVGLSTRGPDQGLHGAWEQADSAMYRMKRRRHSRTDDPSMVSAHVRHTSTLGDTGPFPH